jgi:hypothetical protein
MLEQMPMGSNNAPFAVLIRRPPDEFYSDGVPTTAYLFALAVACLASGRIHRAIASLHA